MPLRPIDAIFVHPKERYYVIYQNGDLYRLTRMKLDFESWTRRAPYTDSVEQIYLTRSQTITDAKLNAILNTRDLPNNLHGCDLSFFLGWWEKNGYKFSSDTNLTAKDTEANASLPASSSANEMADNAKSRPSELNSRGRKPSPKDKSIKDSNSSNINSKSAAPSPSPTESDPATINNSPNKKLPTKPTNEMANNLQQDDPFNVDTSFDGDSDALFDSLLDDLSHEVNEGKNW